MDEDLLKKNVLSVNPELPANPGSRVIWSPFQKTIRERLGDVGGVLVSFFSFLVLSLDFGAESQYQQCLFSMHGRHWFWSLQLMLCATCIQGLSFNLQSSKTRNSDDETDDKNDVAACGFCKNCRFPDPLVSAIWRVGRVYTVYNPCSFPGKRWSIGSWRTWKNQDVPSKGIERGESAPSPSYFAVLRRKTERD